MSSSQKYSGRSVFIPPLAHDVPSYPGYFWEGPQLVHVTMVDKAWHIIPNTIHVVIPGKKRFTDFRAGITCMFQCIET